jgi:hypothetical protein
MNKWIKPDDLPKGFWKECFVAWSKKGQVEVLDGVQTVRKVELYPQWYFETEREWVSFQGIGDYLVMPVEYPTARESDFK